METLQNTDLKAIIKDSLEKSITYQEYRDLVKNLVENNATTGLNQADNLVNYTMLNNKRMKRWDKTVKVSEADKEKISNSTLNQTWLVLTESWCGDAAHIMPVINKVAELNDNIDYKVVLRDENKALMNQFLTNGGQSIPKLVMIDNLTNKVISSFGPRPSKATKLVNDYKKEHGTLTPEFKEELQHWYNKDKGQNVIEDLVAFL
ncbi:thioredoxin family protein [Lacinutrix venerupis]|uniref:Thioredoxin family protein n=1 Tax=Lacinutrix venerupis TaxID=1486034 RepID=A0AAC9PVW0_9FLAO|nr:thioredoxin family protein [Lacinutrix venerupis]APX99167.1 thioredoxin family protein [Lacinutrix venerupis]